MEDNNSSSFKGRVDKIFGSLSSSKSSSPSPAPAPLWSLTDDEVERRQWNRRKDNPDRDDQTPCSSSFDRFFVVQDHRNLTTAKKRSRNQLEDPSDDDDEDDDNNRLPEGDDDEEWGIRSSIGLDCTLDNEEEEDAYDKLAEGRENVGDRVYMKDVTDHGPYLNSHNVLPSSVDDSAEDLQSNNYAAKIRLKEDDEIDAPVIENDGCNPVLDESLLRVQEPRLLERKDGAKVKSILKKKSDTAARSSKRVKFDTVGQDEYVEPSETYQETLAGPSSTATKGEDKDPTPFRSRVPDYLLNPSKYTRYSFDSGDINEESNIRACMDFLGHIKRSNATGSENKSEDISAGHKKSVVFIPRKKTTDSEQIDGSTNGKSNQSVTQVSPVVSVAAGKVDEVSVMEEYEPVTAATCTDATFQKPGRRYRIKSGVEESSS